jgi:hypothetical protein
VNAGLWLLLAYVALLLWALRKKQWQFDGPWWFHLRAFLPNWKFYHAVGWMPRLWVRSRPAANAQATPWAPVYPRFRRRLTHLFHNPEVNLMLARQNLVDHLANDLAALPDDTPIDALPIYHLVQRHAAYAVLDQRLDRTGQLQWQLQWQLRLIHQTRDQTEVVLTTPWTPMSDALRGEDLP